jgi:hypothetical protein
VLDTGGTTAIEFDVNDGSFAASLSSIAGATLPASGTYYLQVRVTSTSSMRPYHLYVKVQSGAPTAETGPNNLADSGQPLAVSGWVSGAIAPAADNDVLPCPSTLATRCTRCPGRKTPSAEVPVPQRKHYFRGVHQNPGDCIVQAPKRCSSRTQPDCRGA